MKKVHLISLLFSQFFFNAVIFGQKTVQFADPQPSGSKLVQTVDKNLFGSYKSSDLSATYIVDESGISIVSTVVGYVTRKQVRESSKLQVHGSFLLGIKENDSVPCVLEGEKYYYGISQKLVIAGEESMNMLTRISANMYVINFHEGDYFEPSLVTFNGNTMTIVHGDMTYQDIFKPILQIKTITRYGSEVAILAPDASQWNSLQQAIFEGKKLVYTKGTE